MGLKENIKSRRLERNLTLEDVARFIGVSKQTVQKYESGVISNIPSDTVELIAECLGAAPADLMGWGDTKEKKMVADTIIKYASEIDETLMLELLKKFNKLSNEDKKLALQLIGRINGGK